MPQYSMGSCLFHQKWQIKSNIREKQPFIVSDDDNCKFRYMYKEKIKKAIFFRIIHRNENVNGEVFTLILSEIEKIRLAVRDGTVSAF